jgi:hypothetical protein
LVASRDTLAARAYRYRAHYRAAAATAAAVASPRRAVPAFAPSRSRYRSLSSLLPFFGFFIVIWKDTDSRRRLATSLHRLHRRIGWSPWIRENDVMRVFQFSLNFNAAFTEHLRIMRLMNEKKLASFLETAIEFRLSPKDEGHDDDRHERQKTCLTCPHHRLVCRAPPSNFARDGILIFISLILYFE